MSANFTPFPDVPASPPHRTLRLLGWGAALLLAACLALAAWRMGGANYFGAHPISINRTTPKVARPLTGLHFSPQPTVTEFLRAGMFEQPLVPVGKPDPEENLALAHDLIAFQRAVAERGPDAVEPIVRFVGAWPHSAWTPALLLDLGLLYRRTGHFSLALDSYRRAWELTRDSVDPNGIRIGDMVLAQLSQFEAYLGRTELLEALLQETRGRPLHGTAAELVSDSYRGLAEMRSLPEISFRCGPMALARILFYGGRHPSPDVVHTLEQSHSTPHGLSLTAVKAVSQKVGLNYQMAFRARGAPVVFPAVAHWKLGHYAALVDEIDGLYLVEDSTFGDNIHMSATTLDEEASGYFLIPPGPLPVGWRAVGEAEANAVWGRGNTGSNTDFGDTGTEASPAFGDYFYSSGEPDPCFNGCTRWNVEAMVVGLSLHDTPVGYTPPVGPAVKTLIQYSQRDALQPMTFAYTNLGPKWTLSWLSYIMDERTASGLVDLYERGGGDEKFTFASPTGTTSAPGMYSQSIVVATTNSSGQTTGFTRQLPDGSVEQFNQAMGSQYFLTAVIDPQGNAVQLTYDSQLRIVSLTDAIGQVTTLSYGLSSDPLKLTKITDPFGRYATLTYNSSGQLASITDVLGITSSFAYGSSDFVNTLTTPYGKTTFTYGDPGTDSTLASASERYVTATDTLGRTSRVEFNQAPPGLQSLGCTSPPNVAPQGMPTACSYLPNLLNYRNTFVWDPYQLTYGATNGVPNYNNAKIMHWLHTAPDLGLGDSTSRVLESMVPVNEDRIWYNYQGQVGYTLPAGVVPAPTATGVSNRPTAIGRVTEAGSQIELLSYNSTGHVTQQTDPVGRQYSYTYASNGIDLLTVANTTGATQQLLATYTYNSQHEVLTYTGANGQATQFQYNARGQLQKATDALGDSTSYSYDNNGFLTTIQGPVSGATYSFTYDAQGRVASATDPMGRTVQYTYDAADRPTAVSFPDGTSASFAYNLLDMVSSTDRMGHTTKLTYDSERELAQVADALGNSSKFGYCPCGALTSITDPNGNVTSYTLDQGERVTTKQFADGSTQLFSYDFGSSAVIQRQTQQNGSNSFNSQFTYNVDGSLQSQSSTGGQDGYTIQYMYDPAYPRVAAFRDNLGTTQLTYYPVASTAALGANQLESVSSPLPNGISDTVTYTYDALDRMATRAVNSATESFTYDALGRVTTVSNPLDTFNFAYSDGTARPSGVSSGHGPTQSFAYLPGTNDGLPKQMTFTGPGGVSLAQFSYTYNPDDGVASFTESYLGQKLAAVMGSSGASLAKSMARASLRTAGLSHIPDLTGGPDSTGNGAGHWPILGYLTLLLSLMFALARRMPSAAMAARTWRLLPLLLICLALGCGGGGGGDTPSTGGGGNTSGSGGSGSSGGGGTGGTGGSGGSGSGGSGGSTTTGLTLSYAYDAANQLLSATPNQSSASPYAYTYDATSNITQISAAGTPASLTYGATNQLTTGGDTFDAEGNTTATSTAQYKWDAIDRLIAVVSTATTNGEPNTESDFTYDGLSRLVRVVDKQQGIVVADHSYFWCGTTRCLAHDNTASGSPVSTQYFAQGVVSGSTPYYYVTDALGSVRQLVDANGNVAVQYEYDPYGNQTIISGSVASDLGYASYFYHAASGLNFALLRAYNPQIGRWLSRDPGGEGSGLNLYAYSSGNPTTLTDPTGLCPGDDGWSFQVPPALGIFTPGLQNLANMLNDLAKPRSEHAIDWLAKYHPAQTAALTVGAMGVTGLGAAATAYVNDINGFFASQANAAGGRVWTAFGPINQEQFAGIVENGLQKGPVNIITGVHGAANGATATETQFFIDDVARFGRMPGVAVYHYDNLSQAELNGLLNGSGTTIGGFCHSTTCLAPYW